MGNAIVLRPFLLPGMSRCARVFQSTVEGMRWANSSSLFARRQVGGAPCRRLIRLAGLFVILLHFGMVAHVARAQELPLERCDALPVIDVQVAGLHKWFLVDTAATSILNLESFAAGHARNIRVTSGRSRYSNPKRR